MRSSREEKVNAFTAEETPLSRIRATAKAKAKVEQDAGHIVLSGWSVIYLELSPGFFLRGPSSAALRGEERTENNRKGKEVEVMKPRRGELLSFARSSLFRVDFKRGIDRYCQPRARPVQTLFRVSSI